MGVNWSCDDDFSCGCFERGESKITKKSTEYCVLCMRRLGSDPNSITGYCSSCKVLDNPDYYEYKNPNFY
jgi:hypothetical protein